MSEFYRLRRTKITDAFALTGFVVGFLLPAYSAGRRMAEGFELGEAIDGVSHFVFVTLLYAFAGGLAGLALGGIVGWVWERVHRVRRSEPSDAGAAAPTEPQRARSDAAAAPQAQRETGRVDASVRFDDSGFAAPDFVALAQRVMPANYDVSRSAAALERTINIGAWDGNRLVGCVRVLTDGYLSATVPEIMVDPGYRRRGIGRELMTRASQRSQVPVIMFAAPPESVGFFERIGCQRAPGGFVLRRRPAAAHT